jgi:Uma2 family endonuclease
MPAALKMPPHPMTVAEFLHWDPGDGQSERWVLRDGIPEMMNPPSDRHSRILARLIPTAAVLDS